MEKNSAFSRSGHALETLLVGTEDRDGDDYGRRDGERDGVAALPRGDDLEHHADGVHRRQLALNGGVGVRGDVTLDSARGHAGDHYCGVEAEVISSQRQRGGVELQRGRRQRLHAGREVAGEDLEEHLLAQLHSHGDQKTLSRRHHAAEEGAIHGAERARKRSEDHVHALRDVRAVHVEQVTASGVEALGVDQVAVDARLEVGELEVRRL